MRRRPVAELTQEAAFGGVDDRFRRSFFSVIDKFKTLLLNKMTCRSQEGSIFSPLFKASS